MPNWHRNVVVRFLHSFQILDHDDIRVGKEQVTLKVLLTVNYFS